MSLIPGASGVATQVPDGLVGTGGTLPVNFPQGISSSTPITGSVLTANTNLAAPYLSVTGGSAGNGRIWYSSGIQFGNSVGNITDAGTWTFGPAAANVSHLLQGSTKIVNSGNQPALKFSATSEAGNANYAGKIWVDVVSQTTGDMFFSTDTAAGVTVGSQAGRISTLGAWTLGPTPSNGTTTLIHTLQANGTVIQKLSSSSGANNATATQYWWNNGTFVGQVGGGTAGQLITGGTAGNLCILGATAIEFAGNNGSAVHGLCSSAGAWTFGASTGSSIAHNFQSGTETTVNIKSASGQNAGLQYYNSTTRKWIIYNNAGSSDKYTIGDATAANGAYLTQGSSSGWTNFSDERLKSNIQIIENALIKIKDIRCCTYVFGDNERRDSGLIAQDFVDILPEAVDCSDPNKYGLQYNAILPLAIKAIQEQQEIIVQLQADIAALKGE